MSLFPLPNGETVTLVSRAVTGTDAYGNDVYTDTSTAIAGCAVAPRSGSELVQGQDTVIGGITVYAPPTVTVKPTDRMVVRGVIYEVDGTPEEWVSPFTGNAEGWAVPLTRVTG